MAARLIWAVLASACLPTALGHAQTPPKPVVPNISATALPVPTANPNVHGVKNIGLSTSNNVLTITQPAGSTTNIVNWQSFNIGKDAQVLVNQPTANSVLLNNVVNASRNPTVINGVLKNLEGTTPGRVYIYDPSGIVFGSKASINLNSLIASSLKFDESRIKAGGLLMPGDTPTDAALRADGKYPGSIWVQPGAKIAVDTGGQIMLAAPGVYNEGTLYAPDGQVILAAGNKVYLASPNTDPKTGTGTKLRGLVVEVENGTNTSLAQNSGNIDVSRGNATMVGYAVNQQGLVSASTSVTMNGSIYLTAQDNTKIGSPRTGDVKLGAGSKTEVKAFREDDPKDEKTITLDQLNQTTKIFNKSEITVLGKNIQLEGRQSADNPGAKISAPGGEVFIKSVNSQADLEPTSLVGNLVRVDLGEGSSIDVSGMNSAKLAMSSNIIEVDLRGTELADNLVLRQSPLYGKKVNVDIRKGAPIANIDGWLKLVPYTLDQVNTAGGKIDISSEGAVIQRTGSLLNVDGGGVTYLPGYANASQLKLNNTLADISLTKPNVAYTQVVNLPDSKNNWEDGYTQGSNAGSVSISGQVLSLMGDMSGSTWAPSNALTQAAQRDVSRKPSITSKITPGYASGGALSINARGINRDVDNFNSFVSLTVGNTTATNTAMPEVGQPFDATSINAANSIRLNIDALKQKGFQNVSATVAGNVLVDAPVVMLSKGELRLAALEENNAQGAITVSSSISAPSGTISLRAGRTLTVQPNVTLSAAGLWTNDAKADELARTVSEQIAGRLTNVLGITKKETELFLLALKGELDTDRLTNVLGITKKEAEFFLLEIKARLGDDLGLKVLTGLGYSDKEASVALNALINKGRGGAISTSGGTVSLGAHELDLKNGVVLDASAGAWVDSWQKFKFGTAGSVNLSSIRNLQSPSPSGLKLGDNVVFKAEGFSSGGSLTVTVPSIFISSSKKSLEAHLLEQHLKGGHLPDEFLQKAQDAHLQTNLLQIAPDPEKSYTLLLTPDFFQKGGFTNYEITSQGDLEVLKNTKVSPQATRWMMENFATKTASGNMANVAKSMLMPVAGTGSLRSTTSLTLKAEGAFLLDDNASLTTDPLAKVNLLAANKLTILGSVINPGGTTLVGITNNAFSETKNIWLGENANLDVNGGSQTLFTGANGVSVGDLLTGGQIQIGGYDSRKGLLIPLNALIVAEKGSRLSADGSVGSALVQLQTNSGVVSTTLSSNAGRIDIQSEQGLILAGSLSGRAGANAVGGTLNLVLNNSEQATLTLSSSSVAGKITKKLPTDGNGWIALSSLTNGGFGQLQLEAQSAIAFDLGNSAKTPLQTLSARDAIVLDSPVLRTDSFNNLAISAPSVQLGGINKSPISAYLKNNADLPYLSDTSTSGPASLTVNASTLDLIGNTSLKGFGVANLNSSGDIRLTQSNGQYLSVEDEGRPESLQRISGVFAVKGNLTLKGSQIYPTTLSDFKLSASENLTFLSNGNVATPVYSAGGSLTAVAKNIDQSGVIKAPLGQIILGDASTEKLDYADKSVTSVKGEAAMIFGDINNGSVPTASLWTLSLPGNKDYSASLLLEGANLSTTYRRALPVKEIISQAKSVNVKSGALLDASPGGELLAFEFTPGGGGSKDVLTNPNTFAILPSYQSSSAPIDPNNTDTQPRVGDKIYLSASGGLAAGVYTLLPAHFALLPGGYSVQVQPNTLGVAAKSNYALPDGSMLVAGSRMSASQSSGNSFGFQVTSGDVIRQKSQFTPYNLNDYFKQQAQINLLPLPELPTDSGYLQMLASDYLTLDGTLRMPSGALDLSVLGQSIKISAEVSTASNTFNTASLNKIQASSLLIGGVRTSTLDVNGQRSYTISQFSKSVELANSSSTTLTANDIILTATDEVKLNAGSSLEATDKPKFDVPQLQLTGGGALLRATGGSSIDVVRSAPQLSIGLLDIDERANIQAGGALYLDATRNINLNGRLPLPSSGFLGIASSDISFGQTFSTGVSMATDALANTKLNNITLTAYGKNPISFAGDVKIGQTSLSNLTINATGLLSVKDRTANVLLNAQTVQLNSVDAASSPLPDQSTDFSKVLKITANDILIGNGQFAITNFGNSTLTASQTIRGTGDQGSMVFAGKALLEARTFTADSAKYARFESLGSMSLKSLKKAGEDMASVALSSVGGSLAFTAPTLMSSADIVLPSGNINFTSTGDVTIDSGSLSVAAASKMFGVDAQVNQLWAYAPAGEIAITGNSINLKGGTFDVSAKRASSDVSGTFDNVASSGSLSFKTNSTNSNPAFTFDLSAVSFNGKSDNPNQAQGQFALQTNALSSSFSALNAKVNQTGFNQALTYRLTQDDIIIASTDTLNAKNITLIADNGDIEINGTLNANGLIGGNISAYAAKATGQSTKGNIWVNGILNVSSTYTSETDPQVSSSLSTSVNLGRGGRVLLSTATLDGSEPTSGATVYMQGGEILTKGSSPDLNGSVLIRVPRTNGNTQLALDQSVNTSFTDAKVTLEGFKVYSYTNITDTSIIKKLKDDATNFPIDSIKSSLSVGNNFTIRPGVEIRSDSNLTVSVNEFDSDPGKRGWDLSGWRFGPDRQPINLTLRSADDLTINGSISDGFVNPGVRGTSAPRAGMAMPNWALGTGPSADINIIAGADLNSANTLATNFNKFGKFTLGFADRVADPSTVAPVTAYDMPVALLRTGTGNINIAAAGDVTLKLMSIDQLVDNVNDKNIKVFDYQTNFGDDNGLLTKKHFVTVVGASIYTAGEVASPLMEKPRNLLNPHYVGNAAKAKTFTEAEFSKNGGSLSMNAGGNIQGPKAESRNEWFHFNNDLVKVEAGEFTFSVDEFGGKENARLEALAKIQEYTADKANYGSVSQEPIFVKDRDTGDYFTITFNRLSTQDWLPTSVSPLVNTWLFRQGRSSINTYDKSIPAAWWVRTDYFNQSMATLGGGDLAIRANGSIKDIYASTATNAYTTVGSSNLVQQGGGDLTMAANGDLAGVAVYVQKGIASLASQGNITSGGNWVSNLDVSKAHTKTTDNKIVDSWNDPRAELNSIFAVGDARLNLTAFKNITIGAVYNPTLTEQSVFNRTGDAVDPRDGSPFSLDGPYSTAYPIYGQNSFLPTQEALAAQFKTEKTLNKQLLKYSQFSNFSTYSEFSGLNTLSLGGSVSLINDKQPVAWSGSTMVTNELVTALGAYIDNNALKITFDSLYTVAPGRSQVVAMNGKLDSNNGFAMMASKQGHLAWWAKDSVSIQNGASGVKGALNMLDISPDSVSNANAPRLFSDADMAIFLDSSKSNYSTHALIPLHTNNVQPASFVSLYGDVKGDANYALASFNMPKATTVLAGRDILNLGFTVQNVNPEDVTLLQAGRDIRDETVQGKDCTAEGSNCLQHLVSGPGVFRFIAGRDIDLGNQSGVVTKGNQTNPYLPEGGASIELMTAGMTTNYAGLNAYINETLVGGPFKSTALDDWRANYATASAAEKNKYFFQMLVDAGEYKDAQAKAKDPNTKVLDLTYFDDLIDAMLATKNNKNLGDLSSHSSQIKTVQGGSIDIFVPAGSVYAGLTMGAVVDSPANQGLFTIRGGDLNALVKKNFSVNQGRVFTLSGGDITLVSQYGDLEAGKGAKTASSAPPPLVTFDVNGTISVDVSRSVQGSGIKTVSTGSTKAGSIYLMPPRGGIDAGDAGIESGSGLTLGGLFLKNADNIVAAGPISNSQAPTVAPPSMAPVASPAAPAPASSDDMKKSLASNTTSSATLSVELLGLGDGKSDNANTSSQANSDEEDKEDKEDKDGKDKPKNKP